MSLVNEVQALSDRPAKCHCQLSRGVHETRQNCMISGRKSRSTIEMVQRNLYSIFIFLGYLL